MSDSISAAVSAAASALARASVLLEVLDREHTSAEVHQRARAVRQEVRAALEALGGNYPRMAVPDRGQPDQMSMQF